MVWVALFALTMIVVSRPEAFLRDNAFIYFLSLMFSVYFFLKSCGCFVRSFLLGNNEKEYRIALEDAIKSPRDSSKYTKALQLGRQFYRNAGKSDAAVELAVQNDLKSIAK